MKKLFRWYTAITLALGLGVIAFSTSMSQEMFPEGEGRETLLLVCTQCHALNRMTEAELTADDWEFIVYDMISRGSPVYKDDIEDLKKYLIDNFAIDKQ
jgi:hypothetical protein